MSENDDYKVGLPPDVLEAMASAKKAYENEAAFAKINNRINAISGYLEFLKRKYENIKPSDKKNLYFKSVEDYYEALVALNQKLMALTKQEAESTEEKPMTRKFNEVAGEMHDYIAMIIGANNMYKEVFQTEDMEDLDEIVKAAKRTLEIVLLLEDPKLERLEDFPKIFNERLIAASKPE